jgi:hypothetical protein
MAQKLRKKKVQKTAFQAPNQTFANIKMTLMEGTTVEKFGALADLLKILEDKPENTMEIRSILKNAMNDRDERVGWATVFVLGKIGQDALPELTEGLKNNHDAVKSMSAAMIAGILKKDDTMPILSPVLPELYPEAVRTLIGSLDEYQNSVRVFFMSALSEITNIFPSAMLGILENVEQTDEVKELWLQAITILRKNGWHSQA